MSPEMLLISGLLVLAFLSWLFWPDRGLLASLNRLRQNSLKVQLEDALKFLFDCEYRKKPCGINSLAGNLNVSTNKMAGIIERLQELGLIISSGEQIKLTDAGRSYALRIIRVHRIWEQYLADETSLTEDAWHREADIKEHQLSAAAAEKLAGQLGNPVYDPHGDPIPTASGQLPELKAISLTDLQEGEHARIMHLEDEPAYIYNQLVALGLYPGMNVYVMDKKTDTISIAANGEEINLSSLFATAVSVEKISAPQLISEKPLSLSSLRVGEKGIITGISLQCRGQQRRRLLDLGMVPGTVVTAEIRSASGDPVGYNVKGATIGIRKQQADLIYIKKTEEVNNAT